MAIEVDAMILEGSEQYEEICREKINRKYANKDQFNARCATASKKMARCELTMLEQFVPEKAWNRYFTELARGMNREEAKSKFDPDEAMTKLDGEEALFKAFEASTKLEACLHSAFRT